MSRDETKTWLVDIQSVWVICPHCGNNIGFVDMTEYKEAIGEERQCAMCGMKARVVKIEGENIR